ncbi:FecR family protein [Cyclobacterium qasimii]|uniref:Anti-sigma factor n=1 Tax=Cyclobacterium qasimii TaxID=1350429 RepID=A0A512CB80_9BACT|nr:FecR domain-containing protein [Cyclobacterium qasimii]GEO21456.1 hypothetical protein CQA01_19900 [Cyclobacterium qasimii]
MKSYEKIDDFLEDESFKQWVLNNDAEQAIFWQDWLNANPTQVELLGQAKTILLELDASALKWKESRKKKTFLAIKDKIIAAEEKKLDSNRYVYTSGNGRLENRIRLFLGGSILALFSLVLVYAFMTVDYNKPIAQETKSDEWIIKTNPKGQKSTLMLSDGSNVVLNAESELRFKREFGQSHREIYLTGEAFFEVASDSLLPFRVHSGDLITTALGTSFNINSYKENWVQVQLATGKVRVSNISEKNQAVDLVPGEEVVIGNDSQLIKSKFDLNKAFYWKEGVLGFEKVPFEEVVQSLERWYAVDIQVKKPPSSSVKISGEFKKNTYLKDVLESLGYAYNFDFSIRNKTVLIQFKASE